MEIYSQEAEQAVIGGLMLDNSALGYVLDAVGESDFFMRSHRIIFSAIMACDNKSTPFDVVSLADELHRNGELENIGDIAFLGHLAANTPTSANIKTYARIVREKSLERKLAQSANEIHEIVAETGLTPQEKIDKAGALLMELTDDKSTTGIRKLSETLNEWVMAVDERFNRGGEIVGISTGFSDIDKITAGLNKSDLVIIAGRPSMGKTTLAMNIAENVALEGTPVAVFSLEMPTQQLTDRMIASIGRIHHESIRTGRLSDSDFSNITLAVSRVKDAPIYIDDTAALSIADMRNRARRVKKQANIGLIVVDYLQLMHHHGSENRTNEIGAISRGLKQIAKELNVPVIALSQLSRTLENRQNKRPIMSDLRESGSIEQDADVIAFVYRDEVYNEDTPDKGIAEIIFRKQRNGPIGTVRMVFNGAVSRFDDLAY